EGASGEDQTKDLLRIFSYLKHGSPPIPGADLNLVFSRNLAVTRVTRFTIVDESEARHAVVTSPSRARMSLKAARRSGRLPLKKASSITKRGPRSKPWLRHGPPLLCRLPRQQNEPNSSTAKPRMDRTGGPSTCGYPLRNMRRYLGF